MKKILILPFLVAIMPVLASTDYSETSEQSTTTKSTQTVVMTAPTKTTQTIKKKHGTVVNNFYFSPTTHVNTNNSNNKNGCCDGNRGVNEKYYPVSATLGDLHDANSVNKPQQEKTTPATQNKVSASSESSVRKYYLAHPFFQPQAGHFGSITDFSYAKSSMDVNLINAVRYEVADPTNVQSGTLDISNSVETTQFVIKEDISFGITDNLALLGMLQYDSTKTQFEEWSNGTPGADYSNSGLNIFGVGMQYRFVDNSDWIAHVAGYFQHQKDSANSFMVDLKAGYKVSRTTIYGLVRGTYSELIDGTAYGIYVEDGADWLALTYKTDVDNFTMVDFGVGVFSVLSKDWTLNIEGVFGNYDWHNQAVLKGAHGWQPGNNFALTLYGK
ncbi:MAG: hypothetical protein MJ158_04250, partial [Alphaproteobacteria bacterium]|nr:hypothetical protein [Alphaproteobacteria bacterium]